MKTLNIINDLSQDKKILKANLYGQQLKDGKNLCFNLDFEDMEALLHQLKDQIFSTKFLIKINNTEYTVILREIQMDPVTDEMIHVDLWAPLQDQKIITEIPVLIKNKSSAPFIKEGGILFQPQKRVKIKTIFSEMPEFIECDVSSLGKGHKIKTDKNLWGVQFVKPYTLVTILDK